MLFDFQKSKSILDFRINSVRNKKFYFLLESLLEELSNINHFILKLILTKSIPTKSILSKINFTKIESNTLYILFAFSCLLLFGATC